MWPEKPKEKSCPTPDLSPKSMCFHLIPKSIQLNNLNLNTKMKLISLKKSSSVKNNKHHKRLEKNYVIFKALHSEL
jgi:hypothetical protein